MNVKRCLALFAATACVVATLFALTACGSGDAQALKGVWQVKDTTVTVVFTDDKFKTVGNEYDYTVDTGSKTITYVNGAMTGEAHYSFSEDLKQLTLEEPTQTTVFDKVSDDISAEPSAGEEPANEG